MTGRRRFIKRRRDNSTNTCLDEQIDLGMNQIEEHYTIRNLLQDQAKPRSAKRVKTDHSVPVVYAKFRTGKDQYKKLKVLLDSGASATCVNKSFVKKFRRLKTPPTRWVTAAGKLHT